MVVGEPSINNIMSGIENTGGVKQHNHKKKLRQRFDIIKKLGQGTFGKVQLGINKETGQEVAIKTIKKSKIESDADLIRIRREIQIMSSVQHPNIIHIYEVFENREKMVLVMEYAAGGELYDYLSERKVLNEEEARRIFRQIATACYYCHKHKICHRDLKLENILLDENNNAKIADFGLSNVFDDQRLLNTFCGSPLYASPEIVKGTPYHGPEVDCWSLGVLLYTLVYGAMPFDGSNFKRLVKQISQGDYFEPANPSPASPLIRDMLTVNPKKRADIEKICTHWWVNEGYDDNCLDISEELANQTPVRLDVLLSLAPPPPQLESDKLVVTADAGEGSKGESVPPTRSQSVGSLMELSHPERRIIELLKEDKIAPKRKLESTLSTDRANLDSLKKEKIIKDNTIADISLRGIKENDEDTSMEATVPLNKSSTQTLSREMDFEQTEEVVDPQLQGAACSEIIEEAKDKDKVKKTATVTNVKKLEGINEIPSQENIVDKENSIEKKEPEEKKVSPKKTVKKKVLSDKNENKKEEKNGEEVLKQRRKSRIFEAAEKFQNMASPPETKPVEKPKKLVIPGVSVDGFKKEFERKASLTSSSPPKLKPVKKEEKKEPEPEERKELVRNAVNIISSALDKDKEGARKSKSRPCMMRKPPVPFGASGRSASGNIGMITPLSPPPGPKPFVKASSDAKQVVEKPPEPVEDKTSSAEITLKSATLPRRKTAKAEIQLNYPVPRPMGFKTEMAHNVQSHPKLATQRSEVVVPVASPPVVSFRASSVEPKTSRERIIPISFEREEEAPKVPKPVPNQKSNQSLSRQSTQESDGDSVVSSGEPIKKSPREYIIPIAVEGGGYVTPRSGSLEPESTSSLKSRKFGRRRLNDRDEDNDTFGSLHRHSSFGKDSDGEDSRSAFHMLRSSRPKKSALEHNDSLSSGEEDDDDGFEILTAENLFSTLLSRVRDLTQRLNVEDNGRPGFPTSRLLSHFDQDTNFFNRMPDPRIRHSPLGRAFSRERSTSNSGGFNVPWRRSVSRDLASDIDSVFNQSNASNTIPRGDKPQKKENLNLEDLDLKKLKLSEEDALALSYLTPGLSKRIQKQLLAQLAPSEARKLSRTMSSCSDDRRSVDRITSTLPRRYSTDREVRGSYSNLKAVEEEVGEDKVERKSQLPIKKKYRSPYEFNIRSSSIGAEPRDNSRLQKPKLTKYCSSSPFGYNEDSSLSESSSRNDEYRRDSDSFSSSRGLDRRYGRFESPEKTEVKRPSTRKISRFLRPDFFDPPKEEISLPVPIKEKKENVFLKEKKERELETQKVLKEIRDKRKVRMRERSKSREKEEKKDPLHEEVNKFLEKKDDLKETKALLHNISNNIRNLENNVSSLHDYVNVPGSYKDFNGNSNEKYRDSSEESDLVHDYVNVKVPERVSKIARPKSYPTEKLDQEKVPKTSPSPEKESKISRLKKGFIRQSSKEKEKTKEDKDEANKSINEEERNNNKNKLLQSIEKKLEKFRNGNDEKKKSNVENAIKKLREQSLPRNLDPCTESGLIKRAVSVEDLPNCSKPLQTSRKSVTKILGLFKKYEDQDGKKKVKKREDKVNGNEAVINKVNSSESVSDASQLEEKKRPKSLLMMKQYNGARSDSHLTDNLEAKPRSRLPVNSYRRSLNLEALEPPKFYRNPSKEAVDAKPSVDRKNLRLDFSKVQPRRNNFLSPDDDSWSVCSDYHDVHSPVSPSAYSGDDNESVIDRIRRKSFYTRFNEKKRPKRTSLKDYGLEKGYRDYSSLDRRALRASSVVGDVGRSSRSPSLVNDYVNLPKYQTYSSRIGRGVREREDPLDSRNNKLASGLRGSISPSMEREAV